MAARITRHPPTAQRIVRDLSVGAAVTMRGVRHGLRSLLPVVMTGATAEQFRRQLRSLSALMSLVVVVLMVGEDGVTLLEESGNDLIFE